jgi:hypothetical protein
MGTVQCQRFTESPRFLAQRVTPDPSAKCLRGLNPRAKPLRKEPTRAPHQQAMWSFMVGRTKKACRTNPLNIQCWQLHGKQALVAEEKAMDPVTNEPLASQWMMSRDRTADDDEPKRGRGGGHARERMTVATNASVCVALFVVRNESTGQEETCTRSSATGSFPTRPARALGGRRTADRAAQEKGWRYEHCLQKAACAPLPTSLRCTIRKETEEAMENGSGYHQ